MSFVLLGSLVFGLCSTPAQLRMIDSWRGDEDGQKEVRGREGREKTTSS